jgi:hypothetical protein
VRVSPNAREAYATLVSGGSVPPGTLVAKLHEDRQDGAAGPIYAMNKLGEGRWEFIVAEPTGELRERGQLARCVRCHAEGVADNLFGLPGRPRVPGGPEGRPVEGGD